jgi:hypothetical protein
MPNPRSGVNRRATDAEGEVLDTKPSPNLTSSSALDFASQESNVALRKRLTAVRCLKNLAGR